MIRLFNSSLSLYVENADVVIERALMKAFPMPGRRKRNPSSLMPARWLWKCLCLISSCITEEVYESASAATTGTTTNHHFLYRSGCQVYKKPGLDMPSLAGGCPTAHFCTDPAVKCTKNRGWTRPRWPEAAQPPIFVQIRLPD